MINPTWLKERAEEVRRVHRIEELDNGGPIIRPAYKPIYKVHDYVPMDKRA